jgi:transposase
MKRHKMRYIKTGQIPAKAYAEKQQAWVKITLEPAIKEAQEEKCHLLFMDAAHFILEPFICALWCVTRLFIRASAGRNRMNVLGAVNALTKEVTTFNNATYINAQTIVTFLKQPKEHYGGLSLKIVLDNACYQHCKLVETVAKQLGIELLFLPSYSPNLNSIERLWKFTKKKILYAKYYDTPAKFHQAINESFSNRQSKIQWEFKKSTELKFSIV